ncbi:MAG: HD domain-containing protein [Candidatus Thiodiazotropha sp. (ex Lucinoma borealis)]|nr:HD domain-containing protein [Candidatus Thiodiazotropha sp. (ex Lucinoma borealis)]
MNEENRDLSSEQEKNEWEHWLKNESKNYIIRIRQAVVQLHEENAVKKGDLPFYTPHGPDHCEMVEDLIHRLLPGDSYKNLEEKERFFLLAAAWLHDLGMERIVAWDVWQEELSPSEIRKRHHITSAKFITAQYQRCQVEEQDKEFLSQLCRFHRKQEDLAKCPEELMVGQKSYRLRMLAAYLRLADALHVDHSRAPSSAYAICLAYDISTESKLHWVKSKLVSGINIIPDRHLIKIEFKIPCIVQGDFEFDIDWLNKKIDYIIGIVLDDIRAELSTVINILTRTGPAYYLDIKEVRAEVFMDDQTINDLFELIMNFNIVGAPSASKLQEMILMTTANIAGYHLKKGRKPKQIDANYNSDKNTVKNNIKEFIKAMTKEVLDRRPCHYGVSNLLIKCTDSVEKHSTIDELVELIDGLFQKNHDNLQKIRSYAKDFLKENNTVADNLGKQGINLDCMVPDKISVLLYGYSETVIEALCGFRDYLIAKCVSDACFEAKDYYNSSIEDKVADKFRIFICEGQPKTQTAHGDRLIYHDGIEYAKALRSRRFKNIIILPDIVVGNVVKNNKIHYFLVGANGFNKDVFKHSAGHESIVNIIRIKNQGTQKIDKKNMIEVVLVASSEKYMPSNSAEKEYVEIGDEIYFVDGYMFWKSQHNESVRSHVWIGRDNTLFEEIHKSGGIMFYNPREDNVPVHNLDWIISDKAVFKISSDTIDEIEKNKIEFVNAMES